LYFIDCVSNVGMPIFLCKLYVDRSMMSIHLLKANLAEDGCDEAQLDVAKKLLNGDSNDVPSEAMQSKGRRLAAS
jgi:hypothetical protein